MRRLNNNLLSDINNRLDLGESSRSIAKALNISKSTVNNYRNCRQNQTPKPKGGAPSKLTPGEKQEIINIVTEMKGFVTPDTVRRMINATKHDPVCTHTIRRVLKEANFKPVRIVRKPKLDSNKKKSVLRPKHDNNLRSDKMRQSSVKTKPKLSKSKL